MVLVYGCQEKPPKKITSKQSMVAIPWSQSPSTLFKEGEILSWAEALEGSAAYYHKIKANSVFRFGEQVRSAKQMAQACETLAKTARTQTLSQLRDLLNKQFQLFRSVGSDRKGDVLVTAYYEPLLYGSFQRSERYQYPLYKRPPDLLEARLSLWFPEMKNKRVVGRVDRGRLVPYYDRTEIDGKKHKLANKELELVWVDSQVELFFLQIQGSGRIALPGGDVLRVGYHGANGHPYVSIGKILIDAGHIPKEEMSLLRLHQWLRKNPEKEQSTLFANPSYVFFRTLKGGPYGNIQVSLTPGRSIATDHRLFPKGAPGILSTTLPIFKEDQETVSDWKPDTRFVVNQDTGGAIRGPGRVDLFVGFSDNASNRAGVMKQRNSTLYFIAPLDKSNTKPKSFWDGLF